MGNCKLFNSPLGLGIGKSETWENFFFQKKPLSAIPEGDTELMVNK